MEIVLSSERELETLDEHDSCNDISPYTYENGYYEVDSGIIASIDSLAQLVPTVIIDNAYNGDLFRAHFDKSLSELQKSAQIPNAYTGRTIGIDDSKFDPGYWTKMSKTAKIASDIFAIASFATGQYYLNQINSQLHEMHTILNRLEQQFDLKETSQIKGNIEYLLGNLANLSAIVSDESYRQSMSYQTFIFQTV